MLEIYKEHEHCRICNSRRVEKFFQINDLPMPEGHIFEGEKEFLSDLCVYVCLDCWMVQTLQDLDLDQYYNTYTYTTGETRHVKDYMELFAAKLVSNFGISPGDLIVEVGSGDGAQLQKFKDKNCRVLGIEPSHNLSETAVKNGIPTLKCMFGEDLLTSEHIIDNSVKAIIIQYTFDHLQNPKEFLELSSIMLKEDGLLVIEVHDFGEILQRNEACLFTHEHSIYPSSESIKNAFEKHGFLLLDDDFIEERYRRGNSSIFIGRKIAHVNDTVDKIESTENNHLKDLLTYLAFEKKVETAHSNLRKFLIKKASEGLKVCGYGAAGRGVDTCVIAKLNPTLIKYVYDKNSHFWGKLMPVSRIPVKNPENAFDDKPDIVVVFSYGYIDEIRDYYHNSEIEFVSLLDLIGS